jgi:ankyrin repeat protein
MLLWVCLQDGRTALHLSAGQGHTAVIRDLLRKGADPVRRDLVSNTTPCSWAWNDTYLGMD